MKLAKQSEIKSLIVSTLKEHVRPGQELSVNMGIVFYEALTLDGKLVHMPGVKVVLTPASQKTSMGHLSEGGYEFFTKILAAQPRTRNPRHKDPNRGEH